MTSKNNILLQVKNLSIAFNNKNVIKNISFSIPNNCFLGVVGESGSGKSITSLAIMGLLPKADAKITSGTIFFNGEEITQYSNEDFRRIRGNDISMVFQEPMSALNPSMKCGRQVTEVLLQHKKISIKEAKKQVLQLFEKVKLPNVERIFVLIRTN